MLNLFYRTPLCAQSDKYNKAVARATGQAPEPTPGATPETPALSSGMQAMISSVSQEEIGQLMNDSTLEFAPQALTLEEGQKISGFLEGEGPMAEVTDPTTKEMRPVATWVIRSADGNARVSILTSAQLDKKLPPFIGGYVQIIRGKDVKTQSGRRVTDYLVCGPKLANGKQRVFSNPNPTQRALPGGVIDATAVDGTGAPTSAPVANAEQAS
jgi:hypothetical protein